MRRAIAPVLALLLAVLLAGCTGDGPPTVLVASYTGVVAAEPGRAATFAVLVNNTGGFRETLEVGADLPANWTLEPPAGEPSFVNGKATTALVLRVTPPADAAYGMTVATVRVGAGELLLVVDVRDFGPVAIGPGAGAEIGYARILANGPVVATNMKDVRDFDAAGAHASAVNSTGPVRAWFGATGGEPVPAACAERGWTTPPSRAHALATAEGGMRAGETRAARDAGEVLVIEAVTVEPEPCTTP